MAPLSSRDSPKLQGECGRQWMGTGACTRPLYFPGEQDQRMDLSHPVHADNCVLDPDTGECWREPPAYTYRDYRWAAPPGVRWVGLGWGLTACAFLPLQWASLPQRRLPRWGPVLHRAQCAHGHSKLGGGRGGVAGTPAVGSEFKTGASQRQMQGNGWGPLNPFFPFWLPLPSLPCVWVSGVLVEVPPREISCGPSKPCLQCLPHSLKEGG